MGRGGLQFILIIWLQGIWLPQHGYDFSETPLWAGIYMLPLIAGFLIAGPASGWLSDHFGARPFATGGMLLAALSFFLLIVLPVDFAYVWFAAILLLNGIGMGLFASPNSAGVMNACRAQQRGAGAGMLATFMNTASVLSIGVFFTLMIIGLAAALPHTMQAGLGPTGCRRPTRPGSRICRRWRHCSPRSWATTRWPPCSGRTCCNRCRPARAPRSPGAVLPEPDLVAVPHGAGLRVRVRDRGVPDRGRGLAAARRQVPPRRRDHARRRPTGIEPVEEAAVAPLKIVDSQKAIPPTTRPMTPSGSEVETIAIRNSRPPTPTPR